MVEDGNKELARHYFLDFLGFENRNKVDLSNGYKELALIEESFGNTSEAKKYISTALEILSSLAESEYSRNYKEFYEEIDERLKGS